MSDPIYEELSDRERQVLEAVWDGLSVRDVADRLSIGEKTVEFHKTSIMKKWKYKTFLVACRLGLKRRYISA
jgi:DNA-binding NarL/FixJ family response regulator